jgi:thiosulfate/3-mercaptopyruvate sulfurtransferase
MDTRHPLTVAVSFVAVLLVAGGCSEAIKDAPPSDDESGESQTQPAPLNEQVYVDVETFEQYRADGATILDVRSKEDYEEGHIPGALHASWETFKDDDREGAFIESDREQLQQAARELGIDRDRKILVYGPAESTLPARQAWSLEFIGHGEVYQLDGGLSHWQDNTDVDLSTSTPEVETGTFEVAKRDAILATGNEIQTALENDDPVVIFDARSQSEYEGTDDRENPRHGHVPEAIHYNWKNVYADDGTLRPKSELRSELKNKGLLEEGAVVIPYCQGGFRSAVVYRVLRWLGREEVQNYDGSWYQYSRRDEWEVAK